VKKRVELKFDGFRSVAIKAGGKVHLRSRNDNDFNVRYPGLVKALAANARRNCYRRGSSGARWRRQAVLQYVAELWLRWSAAALLIFDLLMLKGKDVMSEPLVKRREPIEKRILPTLVEPILKGSLQALIQSVKAQGLEGLVAKRRNSKYEPGMRSGAWQKRRVNQGQELVIGGYTPSAKNFDALVIGYYDGEKLTYAARTRNGFTPASRVELFKLQPI
jgi:bifunctional non-homologous end joining protein LigD